MFDVTSGIPAVWAGLVFAGVVLLGTAGALPSTAPPDAATAASAVDAVAGGDARSSSRRVDAEFARLTPHQIGLRNDAGTTGAAFAFGPVTPVTGGPLEAVLAGARPTDAFATKEAFRQAVVESRSREPSWTPADRLVVRRVRWGDFEAVLVGV